MSFPKAVNVKEEPTEMRLWLLARFVLASGLLLGDGMIFSRMLIVSLRPWGQPSSLARINKVNGLPSPPTHLPKQNFACRVSRLVRVNSSPGAINKPGSDPLILII